MPLRLDQAHQDLIDISRFAAQHPRLVQGGGGNCSVKLDGKRWVKASGCFMEDVSETRGFAVVSSEGSPLDECGGKASMETPLHTLLGSFVIHTHPIAVAALVSSDLSSTWFKELFSEPHYVWVDYATPGYSLFEKVRDTLKPLPPQKDWVLLLQNHGLFVSSESKQTAMQLHEKTVTLIENFFGAVSDLPEIPEGRYLTPDHVVYGQLKNTELLSFRQKISSSETLLLVRQALAMMERKGGKPRWLPDSEVAWLLGMDEEKYRQQIWKNK